MCDFSKQLVAWMDGELAENESVAIERHVGTCMECRGRVAAYEEVSRRFAGYCDAVLATAAEATTTRPTLRSKLPLWVPVLAGAAAALLLLALLPRSVKPIPVVPQVAETRPAIVVETPATPPKPVQQHRRLAAHKQTPKPNPNWAMAGPAIQIAIPAEAMFPPGAVPEGMNYFASLSLAADGSVQGVRLQP